MGYHETNNCLYQDLIRIAIASARRYTHLRPCLLYDGPENDFTHELRSQGVTVIFHQSRLMDCLEKVFSPAALAIARGAFLRVDIPVIASQLFPDEPYVLYTDCDVLFIDSVEELNIYQPQYLAAGGESGIEDSEAVIFDGMSSGVIVFNVQNCLELQPEFEAFIRKNIELGWAYDQGAYDHFFRKRGRRTELHPSFNYRAYWPIKNIYIPFDETFIAAPPKIIHFHGLKPNQAKTSLEHLQCFDTVAYRNWSRIWYEVWLKEVGYDRLQKNDQSIPETSATLWQGLRILCEDALAGDSGDSIAFYPSPITWQSDWLYAEGQYRFYGAALLGDGGDRLTIDQVRSLIGQAPTIPFFYRILADLYRRSGQPVQADRCLSPVIVSSSL